MIFIKQALLIFLGLCGGVALSGGVFAFITMLGIIPRMAARTNTSKHIISYENAIILGGTLGNIWILFGVFFPAGPLLIILYGLFAGIFVGCLSLALAEVLRVRPIMVNRFQLKEGLSYIILAMALGKCIGVVLQFFVFS